jgi:hypothetical protein
LSVSLWIILGVLALAYQGITSRRAQMAAYQAELSKLAPYRSRR